MEYSLGIIGTVLGILVAGGSAIYMILPRSRETRSIGIWFLFASLAFLGFRVFDALADASLFANIAGPLGMMFFAFMACCFLVAAVKSSHQRK